MNFTDISNAASLGCKDSVRMVQCNRIRIATSQSYKPVTH